MERPRPPAPRTPSRTDQADRILLHPVYSYLVFALVLWALFSLTFVLGSLPMEAIRRGVDAAGHLAGRFLPDGLVKSLIIDGIIAGVGGVLLFLPNILILFFGISVMEETGYMARVSRIMDRVMHRMGLHGHSFIPMVMGLGCNVPAILAARAIPSRSDRVLTILISPLISCSARLPIYVLCAGAFFPGHPGTMVFLMYVLSFAAAFLFGSLFRGLFFRKSDPPVEHELCPYRWPALKPAMSAMWHNARHYLNRIGTVVFAFSIVLFFLSHFPEAHDRQVENSFIGRAAEVIRPALAPAGFDVKLGISLLSGVAAKEMVVGTLAVLNSVDQGGREGRWRLQEALKKQYSALTAFAFMLFSLLYTPCLASAATMVRELKSWQWSLFGLLYPPLLAWTGAVGVFQIGKALGLG